MTAPLTDVRLRDAVQADAAALAVLARDTFLETFGHLYPQADKDVFIARNHSVSVHAARIADLHHDVCVVEREGALIGYCVMGPLKLPFDPGDRDAWEIYQFYLASAAQGAGVADPLMAWALARAREREAQDLYLGVYCDNLRAQRFYTRHGFEIVGRYDFPVGETIDDERIMRRAV
jgi:ribosomal protein S18 acetylase RimI-like enzyme